MSMVVGLEYLRVLLESEVGYIYFLYYFPLVQHDLAEHLGDTEFA